VAFLREALRLSGWTPRQANNFMKEGRPKKEQ
jgi:hypothetical protein